MKETQGMQKAQSIQRTNTSLRALVLLSAFSAFSAISAFSASAFAVERNATPQGFDSGYQLPTTTQSPPRATFLEWVDVAALAVALGLAAYLTLKVRRRRYVIVLMLASLAYFGLWRKGCICPIGAIQNVALALADSSYAIPLSAVAFFALPLLATLAFGRGFCAAVCPLGAVQDLVAVRPTSVPAWLEHTLGVLPYIYLAAAVLLASTGSAFLICQYDPFVGFFRMQGPLQIILIGALTLVIGLFVARPYCRYACPYGAILRVLSRLSWKKVDITPHDCIQCRLCENSCPFEAIRKPTAPVPPRRRLSGKTVLAALIVLAPMLIALSAWAASKLGPSIAWRHPTVALADMVERSDAGEVFTPGDQIKAFRQTGRRSEDLFEQAKLVQSRFALGSAIAGGFVALVICGKLIHLTIRRRRDDYSADRWRCLACGRCFEYCPLNKKQLPGAEPEAKASASRGMPLRQAQGMQASAAVSAPEGIHE